MQSTDIPETIILFLPWLILLIGGAVSLAFFAFWIWMLIDCLQHEKNEENQKLVWTLIIVFTNWIGALIYYFVRRKENRMNPERCIH